MDKRKEVQLAGTAPIVCLKRSTRGEPYWEITGTLEEVLEIDATLRKLYQVELPALP
jgi:hypothetical protein